MYRLALLVVLAVLAFTSCTRYSEPKTEEAMVESIIFVPQQSGTSIGTGVDSNGNLTSTTSSVHLGATYAVVLRCEHQVRFSVQGEDERHRQLWARFTVGERVRVTYREKLDGDGLVTGYDFLDAQPVEPRRW